MMKRGFWWWQFRSVAHHCSSNLLGRVTGHWRWTPTACCTPRTPLHTPFTHHCTVETPTQTPLYPWRHPSDTIVNSQTPLGHQHSSLWTGKSQSTRDDRWDQKSRMIDVWPWGCFIEEKYISLTHGTLLPGTGSRWTLPWWSPAKMAWRRGANGLNGHETSSSLNGPIDQRCYL